ncbi:uncharacterized protein TNCV_2287231 [Trichonephila clavipes]|nr:uncharacterized protein TNCV_2287231 [Trichonephila clavipes]
MVMKTAVSGRATTDLPSLYDELESKIRALESLGRTQEKYGDFLSPLVESCLPEEILIAWERFRNLKEAIDGKRSLEQLLNFLNKEVRREILIELARSVLVPPENGIFGQNLFQITELLRCCQMNSLAASVKLTYSASMVDRLTDFCLKVRHEIEFRL